MTHTISNQVIPYLSHNRMTSSITFSCFWHQTIRLFIIDINTSKSSSIILISKFKLHILYHNLWKICTNNILITIIIHIFTEWWISYSYDLIIPAPTFNILLSLLINWVTMSFKFYQFWYQSNYVEFL